MNLDDRLPSVLKKHNIVHIAGDRLLIGDRRRFPWELTFVSCKSVDEAAAAIRAMVTQGGGPLQVALTAMRWVARQIHSGKESDSLATFSAAAKALSAARPTNTTMARTLQEILTLMVPWYLQGCIRRTQGEDIVSFVDGIVDDIEHRFERDYDTMSDIGASLIEDGEGILTTCFAEHSFILSMRKAVEQGKRITVYVPETRPYLQGSRLTAPSLAELEVPVRLVTDGMGAHLMDEALVSRFMSAADLVAMDGTVVNKVGSLANAVCAAHFGIPYQVFAMSPDPSRRSHNDIVMEQRDGNELLSFAGNPVTLAGIEGYYPAFDRIDASLVDAIITPRGLVPASQVGTLYGTAADGEGVST